MRIPWLAFGLSLILTYLLTPLVRTLAVKFDAVAYPRERDIHKKDPIPRWGGLAMLVGFLLAVGVSYLYIATHRANFPWRLDQLHQFEGIVVAAAFVGIIGALDDKFEISALWQSLGLIGAGVILIVFGVRIEGITNPFVAASVQPGDPRLWVQLPLWFSYFATILWVFGVAKTVDFIDGLDGLAAGVCAICGTSLALMSALAHQYEVTIIAAALVGSCLGFLPFNKNPATIFMGTVGAQFLGFVLAAIAVLGTFKIAATLSVALPILVLGVPIFDGIRVVTQRTINRVPATEPDKTSHIHHILINKGLSQAKAVWVIYGLTLGLCAIAYTMFSVSSRH